MHVATTNGHVGSCRVGTSIVCVFPTLLVELAWALVEPPLTISDTEEDCCMREGEER